MRVYRTHVDERQWISPHLVRITLAGGELDDWSTTGIGDEYVRIMIAPEGAELALPVIGDDFSYSYPDGSVEPDSRVYTISKVHDDGRLDVDIVVHAEGVGSSWAKDAALGSPVGITDPHGLYRPPADATQQIFVCDHTGVPALARILRGLGPEHHVRAHVLVSDLADVIDLPTAAVIDLHWEAVPDERRAPERLEEAVRELKLPDDQRYVWVAGEARGCRGARKYLRRELGWPQSDFYTCGYWQFEADKWNARYNKVADTVRSEAMQAYRSLAESDQGAYLDAIDDIYERAGL